jgi:hypothetical protein
MINSFTVTFGAKYLTGMITTPPSAIYTHGPGLTRLWYISPPPKKKQQTNK